MNSAELIERVVSERAASEKLDLTNSDHRRLLSQIVLDVIGKEQDSPIDATNNFAESILRNVAGYGPIDSLLKDADVWEIMINAPDSIFVKRHSGESGYHDEVFRDDDHVTRIV